MAPRMKQRLVANTLRRICHSSLRWPLESNYTHIRTHTSDPVQKNIYRQCTRGYIYIYIFHLDYLQERKRQPFLRKYKDSNFSLFCEALILMQNSCTAEPKHQFCTQTRNKTNNPIWHARTPGTYTHTYALHGQQSHIHTNTQQTAVFYKIWANGSSCSREIKKKKKILVLNTINAWRQTNKQKNYVC